MKMNSIDNINFWEKSQELCLNLMSQITEKSKKGGEMKHVQVNITNIMHKIATLNMSGSARTAKQSS